MKKRPLLLVALVSFSALLLGVFGLYAWEWMEEGKIESFDQRAMDFRQQTLADFKQGKLSPDQLLQQVRQVMAGFEEHLVIGPLLLETAHQLLEKQAAQQVVDLLGDGLVQGMGPPQMRALLGFQLAAAHEDLQQYSQAISVLNELLPLKVLEDKVYFDLGRYYQRTGQEVKAIQSFDYVIKQYPQSDFTPLAEVYASRHQGEEKKAGKGEEEGRDEDGES